MEVLQKKQYKCEYIKRHTLNKRLKSPRKKAKEMQIYFDF